MSSPTNDKATIEADNIKSQDAIAQPVTTEAVPAEPVKTAPKPFKLPYSNQFDVEFHNINKESEKRYSESFTFGPLKWRLLIFPGGNPNNSTALNNMSCYLDVAEADQMEEGWRLQTQVGIVLKNQICSSKDINRSVSHKFHIGARDIGYAAFHPLQSLYDPYEGFYVNKTLKFHIRFTVTQSWVERPETSNGPQIPWDSKTVTGFVGLQNQGATCYLNSLLQSLYHLPRFRHLVYSINPEQSSSAASLQRLFWMLEHENHAVSTADLTKSFGWNIEDIAVQHDVQELLRKLVDNLEEKVKGSPQQGVFEKLFKGTYIDFIKCINVDYERKQEAVFCDLSLNVVDCDTLEDALRKYTETETLDGDNRYKSEEHGYQDAHKGIKLKDLPPVLHLHLKRFEFQYQNDPPTLEKVNSRQVFPPTLLMGQFFYEPQPDTDDTTYELFGILVHSGSAQAGHYYAFLRTSTAPQWYKFDDSKVSHATVEEAIDDNFGGDEITQINLTGGTAQTFAHEKHSSAYMLVYVRRPDIPMVFNDNITDSELPFVEQMRLELEKMKLEEQARIERAKYTQVRISTPDSLVNSPSVDSDNEKCLGTFDLDKSKLITVKKDDLLKNLKVEIEAQLKIPKSRQRLWSLKEPYDFVIMLDKPYSVEQLNKSISMVKPRPSTRSPFGDYLEVFVEESDAPLSDDPIEVEGENQPHLREEETEDSISAGPLQTGFPSLEQNKIVFMRFWDPEEQKFSLLGTIYVPIPTDSASVLVEQVRPLLEKQNKWYPDRNLKFFLHQITRLDTAELTDQELLMTNLINGHIITAQYEVPEDSKLRFRDVNAFVNFLKNRLTIEFRDLSDAEVEGTALQLTGDMQMQEVLGLLGDHLQWSPQRIRLYPAYNYGRPGMYSYDFTPSDKLESILRSIHSSLDLIFYELLDVDLSDIEGKILVKLHFIDQQLHVHAFGVHVDNGAPISAVIEQAKQHPKVLPQMINPANELRLFEYEKDHMVYKIKQPQDDSRNYHTGVYFGLEEVLPEELEAPEGFKKIVVYICSLGSTRYCRPTHPPFTMMVGPEEPLASVKARIQDKIKAKDECDVYVRNPSTSYDDKPCEDDDLLSELDVPSIFVFFRAPQPNLQLSSPRENKPNTPTNNKPKTGIHLA